MLSNSEFERMLQIVQAVADKRKSESIVREARRIMKLYENNKNLIEEKEVRK